MKLPFSPLEQNVLNKHSIAPLPVWYDHKSTGAIHRYVKLPWFLLLKSAGTSEETWALMDFLKCNRSRSGTKFLSRLYLRVLTINNYNYCYSANGIHTSSDVDRPGPCEAQFELWHSSAGNIGLANGWYRMYLHTLGIRTKNNNNFCIVQFQGVVDN